MNKIFIAFSVLIFWATQIVAQNIFYSKTLSTENGLGSNSVWHCLKDSKGFIWISSFNGLNRFDGYTIENYFHQKNNLNSLYDNFCFQIIELDPNNILIVHKKGLSIYRYNYANFISIPLSSICGNDESDELNIVTKDKNKLWVGTLKSKLCSISIDSILNIKASLTSKVIGTNYGSINDSEIHSIEVDNHETIWIATLSGLYNSSSNSNAVNFQKNIKKLTDSRTDNLYIDKVNRLWFCRNFSSLYFIDLQQYRTNNIFTEYSIDEDLLKTKLITKGASDVISDAPNSYWLTINNEGLFHVILNNKLDIIQKDFYSKNMEDDRLSFPTNSINNVYIDRDSILWLCTDDGISYHDLRTSSFAKFPAVYSNFKSYHSKSRTVLAYNKYLIVGTETDGVYLFEKKNQKYVVISKLDLKYYIYDIVFDSISNTVFIATETGLVSFKLENFIKNNLSISDVKIENPSTNPMFMSTVITSLKLDDQNNLWIGTGRGINYYNRMTNELSQLDLSLFNKSYPNRPIVRDFLITKNKLIWIATFQGLYIYDKNLSTVKGYVSIDPNYDKMNFNALAQRADGTIFIGTDYYGLYIDSSSVFKSFQISENKNNVSVKSLTIDDYNNIWTGTETGLFQITDKNWAIHFTTNNGIGSNLYAHNSIGYYNNLIFAAHGNGINIFDPRDIVHRRIKANLIVTDFSISDTSISTNNPNKSFSFFENNTIVLEPDENYFSIEFSLLDIYNADNIIYKYQLEGVDNDWIRKKNRKYANYSKVPPGTYTFRVKACLNGIDWIELKKPICIIVQPHYWQTWWYYLIVVLTIVSIIYKFITLQLNNIKAKKERELADHKAEMKELFLANMSHEIRTPLNAISGIANLLIQKKPREDQNSYLKTIQKSSELLKIIINDILDFTKIEAGKIELESIAFSIHEVMEAVCDTIKSKADEKKLTFSCKIDDDVPPFITGDPVRLSQILLNLGNNAIKFTNTGSVIIECKKSLVFEDGLNDKVLLKFNIIDTGIGIRPEKLEKIFESFTQESSDTTRKYGGTGLGLSICKQLVEMQNGNISVSSAPLKGSTFTFSIPYILIAEKVNKQNIEKINPNSNILYNIKILLVEDNEFNQIVAVETLNYNIQGVKVDVAINGLEAYEKVRDNNYDVVLMDLQMPEVDGYQATEMIRKNLDSPKKDIYIIAMTANARQIDIDRCFAVGMNDLVPKPFELDDLLNKLKKSQLK